MNPSRQPSSGEPVTASTEDLRALATRFQTLLEKQRISLAQELHDNLTQKLTVVSLELSLLDGSLVSDQALSKDRLHEKVKELGQIVNDMIQSLRKIKAELRPKILDEFGLVAALEWESDAFRKRTGIECRFKAEPEEISVSAHLATELFRMFQEIMSNVAVHSGARRVQIEVKQERTGLLVKTTDDGKGITREQIESPKSIGLLELRERASALGGELLIDGSPGRGTTVAIRVPVSLPSDGSNSLFPNTPL